ncbi:hypothetical protein GE09DRAFT_260267 [Coniochaeta sp. 2T2.1]|nr:hypothetical protein GE09DRAFT_260267 [Coniochaeta sp. 2T2.1]
MAPNIRSGAAFLVTTLLLAIIQTGRAETVLNQYEYCIKYFGSMSANLGLPRGAVQKNYNDTITCPTDWEFPTQRGATLRICPIMSSYWSEDSDGVTLDIELSFMPKTGELNRPIDGVGLRDLLVTNGTVPGPFTAGGIPATLAEDPKRSTSLLPVWTINGTEQSMINNKNNRTRGEGFLLSCNNFDRSKLTRYCGFSQDVEEDGCWVHTTFQLTMEGPGRANYTIRFSDFTASVEMWVRQEYFRRSDGAPTGFFEEAYFVFNGGRDLPSIVDYAYWTNSFTDYEQEKADLNDVHFEADDERFPVFVNRSTRREAYSARNGTYINRSWGSTTHVPVSMFVITAFSALVSGVYL